MGVLTFSDTNVIRKNTLRMCTENSFKWRLQHTQLNVTVYLVRNEPLKSLKGSSQPSKLSTTTAKK